MGVGVDVQLVLVVERLETLVAVELGLHAGHDIIEELLDMIVRDQIVSRVLVSHVVDGLTGRDELRPANVALVVSHLAVILPNVHRDLEERPGNVLAKIAFMPPLAVELTNVIFEIILGGEAHPAIVAMIGGLPELLALEVQDIQRLQIGPRGRARGRLRVVRVAVHPDVARGSGDGGGLVIGHAVEDDVVLAVVAHLAFVALEPHPGGVRQPGDIFYGTPEPDLGSVRDLDAFDSRMDLIDVDFQGAEIPELLLAGFANHGKVGVGVHSDGTDSFFFIHDKLFLRFFL